MIDATLVNELGAAPSSNWPKLIERHQAVSAYLETPKASTLDVDHFADQTGMSRRMFYRLIAGRRKGLSDGPAPSKASRGRTLLAEQTDIIAKAIANVRPGSPCKDIIDEVARLSCASRQAVPSDFTIISRLREGGDINWLKAKSPHACSLIIDACSTDLKIQSDDGLKSAWLVALMDRESGLVLASTVRSGPPNALALATVLLASRDKLSRWSNERAKIGVTKLIADAAHALSPLLEQMGFATCRLDTLCSGEALCLCFGRKLGEIRLRIRPRREAKITAGSGVSLEIAAAVVSELIERANTGRSAASPSSVFD